MARSVAQINSYLVDNVVTQMALVGITVDPTLWSKRSLLRCIIYIVAIGQALMEQLQDQFIADVEAVVATAAAASAAWVQGKMFQFQFSSTNPQFVTLINTVPMYPIVDPTLQIITACSVTSDISNSVSIKVAKLNPFQALTMAELNSAQGYINSIGDVGIDYNVISLNPDQIMVAADVFFQGQYASIIQASVIASIQNFLQQSAVTNFNGKIKMSDLEAVIRDTAGVNDVVLKNVRGRADSIPYANGIDLILNTDILQRQWNTIAGYSIPETTAGFDLASTLNFVAE